MLAVPHDCFKCLSVCPEMRITDFQLTVDEELRREFQLRYGGAFACFPTFGKQKQSQQQVKKFARLLRTTSML